MSILKPIGVSDIRKNWAEFFTDAVYKYKLIVLSRHDKEKAFLLGEKLLDSILEVALESSLTKPKCELLHEEDGSITLHYLPLDLLANEMNYEEAVDDLISQAKDYAEDYLADLNLYMKDKARKAHLPLLILIATADSDEEIRNILNPDGNPGSISQADQGNFTSRTSD